MTIQEMQQCERAFLTAADVAPVLNCDPQVVRIMARTKPERLGFPVNVMGNRTRIPRVPFLQFIGAGT